MFFVGSFGSGVFVAEGRPWKYLSEVKFWPMSEPSRSRCRHA